MLRFVQPLRQITRIVDIPGADLLQLGVEGVILDLDNTLTAWRSVEVTTEVAAWVAHAQTLGLRMCIVSNALSARRVQVVADGLGIPWVTRAAKPLPFAYRRGMALLGTTPATTIIIGDQLFTDILGGKWAGIMTLLVDPLTPREALFTRLLQRPLERLLGRR